MSKELSKVEPQSYDDIDSTAQVEPENSKNDSMNWLVRHKSYEGKSSSTNLSPKNPATIQLYFDIYQDYCTTHKTMAQLAVKYKRHPDHIGRVIKWVSIETDDGDRSVYTKATTDKLSFILQDLERELMKFDDEKGDFFKLKTKEKIQLSLKVRQEIRLTIKLMAQARQILSPDRIIAAGNQNVQINIPNLGRGEGIEKAIVVQEKK